MRVSKFWHGGTGLVGQALSLRPPLRPPLRFIHPDFQAGTQKGLWTDIMKMCA